MHDDLFESDQRGELPRERPDRPADTTGPLADREVPLSPVATTDVIHRWLDGELPEPAAARGDVARAVDFWHRIGEETERRRRVVTPAHLTAQIMAALPPLDTAPAIMPWWRKELRISQAVAIALAVGAFALGMLVMRTLAGK
jgi:hypothetical protein